MAPNLAPLIPNTFLFSEPDEWRQLCDVEAEEKAEREEKAEKEDEVEEKKLTFCFNNDLITF